MTLLAPSWSIALFSAAVQASETAACTRCARHLLQQQRRRHVEHHNSTRYASSSASTSNQQEGQPSPTAAAAAETTRQSSSNSSGTQQTFHTLNGRVRVDLSNRGLIGVHQSRGERPYQEDAYAVHALELERSEILRALETTPGKQPQARSRMVVRDDNNLNNNDNGSASSSGSTSSSASSSASSSSRNGGSAGKLTKNEDLEQVVYAGVFDGHNGSAVSSFLKSHLHDRILSIQDSEANAVVRDYRALGGYMRRYRGGSLEGWVDPPAPRRTLQIAKDIAKEQGKTDETSQQQSQKGKVKPWNVLQRLHATFLKTDLEIIKTEEEAGSTCTVALLHSLDEPRTPFFAAEALNLLIAHCGDTRALLCTCPDGTVVPLTENHHPDARSETDRLMRIRTGAVTDSFGESRWAGTLANTRSFGDAHYKALGVFSEPQLVSKTIKGNESAFLMLISDGVTEQLSDQEIVDLVRGFSNPSKASKNVIGFAESIGAQDNLTCLIIPLLGWGKITGPDTTLARREFRLKNFDGTGSRQMRM